MLKALVGDKVSYPGGRNTDSLIRAAVVDEDLVVRSEVTVERRRKDSATTALAPAQLDELALEDAFTRMAADYGETTNKVITRTQTEIHGGHGRAEIITPPEPGSYVLRVLVTSPVQDTKLHSSVASGFSLLLVGLAPGP